MKYPPLIAITTFVTGCSVSSFTDTTDLIDYSNHKSVKVLEIPADLDRPDFDTTYVTNVSDGISAKRAVIVDSSVPLVDSSMGGLSTSSVTIVKEGSQLVLKVSDSNTGFWENTNAALKSMGMTISKSDQASGMVYARDRSLVSSTDNFIGQFFNETIGRMNEGAEYRVLVKSDSIVFTDKVGGILNSDESRSLLGRLKKELTDSE